MIRWSLAAALLAALAAPVAAQPTPEVDKQARTHFKKGITAYNLGDYETAITEIKKSYELSSAPQLLFNLAQAYRAKQDFPKALLFYRNYLRLVPEAANRSDAETLAVEMEQRIAAADKAAEAERRRKAAIEDATRRAADEEARRRAADDAAARRQIVIAPAGLVVSPPPPPKPIHKRWYFWTGLVGGAVVIGVTAGALAGTVGVKTVLPSGSLGTIDGRQ